MAEFRYDEFVCRNLPLLTSEQQQKLRATMLLVAGCGTGSVTAEAAARMGFERFVLVDGDTVEITNMNRQSYEFADVGTNKAQALAGRLRRINPHCKATAITEYLGVDNVASLVDQSDIVIDAVDFLDINAIVVLHREARSKGKPVVTAINLGWGSVGMVFTPDSVSFEELLESYFEGAPGDVLEADVMELAARFLNYLPDYLTQAVAESVQSDQSIRDVITDFPQPAIAAMQCATLVSVAVVRLTLGLPTTVAPQPVYVDPWLAFAARG